MLCFRQSRHYNGLCFDRARACSPGLAFLHKMVSSLGNDIRSKLDCFSHRENYIGNERTKAWSGRIGKGATFLRYHNSVVDCSAGQILHGRSISSFALSAIKVQNLSSSVSLDLFEMAALQIAATLLLVLKASDSK